MSSSARPPPPSESPSAQSSNQAPGICLPLSVMSSSAGAVVNMKNKSSKNENIICENGESAQTYRLVCQIFYVSGVLLSIRLVLGSLSSGRLVVKWGLCYKRFLPAYTCQKCLFFAGVCERRLLHLRGERGLCLRQHRQIGRSATGQ